LTPSNLTEISIGWKKENNYAHRKLAHFQNITGETLQAQSLVGGTKNTKLAGCIKSKKKYDQEIYRSRINK
jgi:hypothetical protein